MSNDVPDRVAMRSLYALALKFDTRVARGEGDIVQRKKWLKRAKEARAKADGIREALRKKASA